MRHTMPVAHRSLAIRVHQLADPPLWSWEIVDEVTGRVLRSSWHSHWMAYRSREDAIMHARSALKVLVPTERSA